MTSGSLKWQYIVNSLVFTMRLHIIQSTVLLSQLCLHVRLSVCLSVRSSVRSSIRLSDACIVTKLNDGLRIFWYHRKRQYIIYHSSFLTPTLVAGRYAPLPVKHSPKVTHPLRKTATSTDFRSRLNRKRYRKKFNYDE